MPCLARRHQRGRLTYASRPAIHIWIHAPPYHHVTQRSRQPPKRTSERAKGKSEQQNATSITCVTIKRVRSFRTYFPPPTIFCVEAVLIALPRVAMHDTLPHRCLEVGGRARTRWRRSRHSARSGAFSELMNPKAQHLISVLPKRCAVLSRSTSAT